MNIILIISDTFRYDNLFDRAVMPVRTPELDNFSKRAVSLSRFYNSSFPTIPHRTDLTSGRYGWVRYPWQDRRLSSPNHLPVLLKQQGYVSQLLCDCPHLFPTAFNVGFDAALVNRGQESDIPFLRMNHPINSVMPPEKTRQDYHFQGRNLVDIAQWTNQNWYREADRFPPRTASLAIEWLEENYQRDPFFLWVDFFDPHEPWNAPEYMVRRYDPDYNGTPMLHPNYGKASDYTPSELRNLRAHYCAEAELVDRWVGRVLQKIDDLDLWRNSIVVFTTDHGMSIGEHNRTGKSNINKGDPRCWPIYPEIAHIPFMVAAPGLIGGTTVDALLQPTDIVPTLFDLAGIPCVTGEPLQGRSFAHLVRGEKSPLVRDYAISGSFLRPAAGAVASKWVTPVLYTERWAYAPIGPEGERQLFALETDPNAEVNIAQDNP
ncbi:MAG: sulfatase, partial [Anaerolineae bacterium]